MKVSSVVSLFFALFVSVSLASPAVVSREISSDLDDDVSLASPPVVSREISRDLYDDLVRYTQYSSAAYQLFCGRPLGNTLVRSFERRRTQGFIARDDNRTEIVVSFRGTFSLTDAVGNAKFRLRPFDSPGITAAVRVHRGFLAAYNNVVNDILQIVRDQLAQYPGYRIVVTGHSLGGAIASLAAPSIKTALPNANITLFTFGNLSKSGQPRVGDADYAAYVEELIGVENIFRGVFFYGVPTMVPRLFGYQHFATEYWQFRNPRPFMARETTVRKCEGPEDPSCSLSIRPSRGINPAHTYYFGQVMAVNPLLCI
ncbi:alpha/beta-hydrolase [Mycena maculata]|uniref:Alpha/beta-hydrolase n=1 Tax=Mycena maculata TaxID=230809 RepID=A0AAD7K9M9_9AGAR|nr:alpha/beta-hydrolase [Mycena maculata]